MSVAVGSDEERATRAGRRRRRVEREPAVSLEPDLDPGVRVVVGEAPAGPGEGRAGEADGDASRNADVPEHERHRAGEVLAVPAPSRERKADERRRDDSRVVRIREAAAGDEPALEGEG